EPSALGDGRLIERERRPQGPREANMTIRCLLAGCCWSDGVTMLMGRETFLCQCCSRCGSHRYTPQT
ncbi:PSPA7_2676 family Cys-rich small protein, partial [Escherichia coli]|uniref:PSPA7_2676 family Cys-rich small protein n=1 Tax=Escherichia coli TaxID=562 RepID=UPI0028DF9D1B